VKPTAHHSQVDQYPRHALASYHNERQPGPAFAA